MPAAHNVAAAGVSAVEEQALLQGVYDRWCPQGMADMKVICFSHMTSIQYAKHVCAKRAEPEGR